MIVPMKKVTVIVQAKDAESCVAKLRKLGVVHIEHLQQPKGKDINSITDDTALLSQATGILSGASVDKKLKSAKKETQDWRSLCLHIVDLRKHFDQLKEYSVTLLQQIDKWKAWGDFEPKEITSLRQKNIYLKLYQVPHKQIERLPSELAVKKISVQGDLINCAVFSTGNFELPYKEIEPPKLSLSRARERLKDDAQVMSSLEEGIKKQVVYLAQFLQVKKNLEKELELHEVLRGMGVAGQIMYITGYLPFDRVELVAAAAKENLWGILTAEPAEEDNVPTCLRNPPLVDIISPVFKLLEIIPGYRELDISPLFLCFLSLFFGMIIGDAGYGLVYFLLTFFMHKKLGARLKDRRIFYLFYTFSSCAIFWGLLTGTVFGQEWYLKSGLKPIAPILNDTKFLQTFCFCLGAFHLSLAHAWQALRKFPSINLLADVGWICILWGAFFLAKTLILNDPFPGFGKYLIIAGLGLITFCTSPSRNILKTIAGGLSAVALNLMNNFTDVVSYVRLFAVGLAGVAIADTVNTLAAGLGPNIVAKTLIVFLGHSINIILGPMSVLVHGIRLNVLEFSGHVGLSWSGLAYKPLEE